MKTIGTFLSHYGMIKVNTWKALHFTLHIVIKGRGTVWVDDVVLFREPLH